MSPKTKDQDYSEAALERATLEIFVGDLEWDAQEGLVEFYGETGTLGRNGEREVVLVRYLREALKKLNPDLLT